MGYIIALIALLAGTAKGYLGKGISSEIVTQRQSVFVNFIRMLFCILISIGVLFFENGANGIKFDIYALIFGAMSGIMTSLFIVTWLLAVKHGAFMLVSVAQMFGVIVTLICSHFVFREKIRPIQFFAIAILIAAVLIMVSYNSRLNGKLTKKAIVLLVICGASNGFLDFSQKLFTHFSSAEISMLNLITYVISAVFLAFLLCMPSKNDRFDSKALLKKTAFTIGLMSICLFVNSYFKALATQYLPSALLYPFYQAGGLILSALMSSAFFKERITLRCVLGLILAFTAIILLK